MKVLKACALCLAVSLIGAAMVKVSLWISPVLALVAVAAIWWFLLADNVGSGRRDYRGGDFGE